MSSTDKTEDKAAEGYTVGDELAAPAPSGSPDPTTTSPDAADHKPAEAAATSKSEVDKPEDNNASAPTASALTSTAEEPAAPPAAAGEESAPTEAAPEAEGPVGYLKSMFPEMDTETLEAVLAAHNGSVENAIEALLAMSDPSAAPPQTVHATQSLSQLQLDEALAKQLYAEDHAAAQRHEQQQQQSRSAPLQPQHSGPPPAVTYQAYVPRARRTAQDGQQGQQGAPQVPTSTHAGINPGERDSWHNAAGGFQERHKDELDELTETMTKLADQGKRTFQGLWGKAKEQAAKINEQINASASPSTAQASTSAPAPPPKQPQPHSQPRTTTTQPQRQSSLPSRYTNTNSSATPAPPSVPDKSAAPASTPAPTPATPDAAPAPVAKDTKDASPATTPAAEGSSSASGGAGEQPKADFSKIGLLPRQSISLLDRKKKAGEEESDSEDDLEYVKSPFDDD